MSDMYGAVKSNDFAVKDVQAFKKWFAKYSFGNEIEVFDDSGDGTVAFGGYEQYPNAWPNVWVPSATIVENSVLGQDWEGDWEQADLDQFAKELREHLEGDSIFVVVAAGHEKLRYVSGNRIVISKDKLAFDSISSDDEESARELLARTI